MGVTVCSALSASLSSSKAIVLFSYEEVSGQRKTTIVDELCRVSGYHRKHATRLLLRFRGFQKGKPKKRSRCSAYDHDGLLKLRKGIWLASNFPSSKRLKALMLVWLPGYVELYGALTPETLKALVSIFPPTIVGCFARCGFNTANVTKPPPTQEAWRQKGRQATALGAVACRVNHANHQRSAFLALSFSESPAMFSYLTLLFAA